MIPMTPSDAIRARIWASVKFLIRGLIALALEWEAITGFRDASISSQKPFSARWETSMIKPSRLHSRISSNPAAVNPPFLGSRTPSAAQLARFQVMPTLVNPRR